jgi:hypothetical protein
LEAVAGVEEAVEAAELDEPAELELPSELAAGAELSDGFEVSLPGFASVLPLAAAGFGEE